MAGGSETERGELAGARAAYARRAWAEAHRAFAQADGTAPLAAGDLELFAWSSALTGQDDDFLRLLDRLYQLHLHAGDERRAARAAFWIGLRLNVQREAGRAAGWLTRAQRLTERNDCVERGYLLLPVIYRGLAGGNFDAALAAATEAAAIGDRFRERDLSAFARCLQGCALMRQGQVESGLALLDEAMVSVTTEEVGPMLTGFIYCTAIANCGRVYLMDRSREWTAALATWVAAQPELVLFSARCLVHRAELMQLSGAWGDAIDEARRASARVGPTSDTETAADSLYQQGEVHRLRGDFAAAERAYRDASERGRDAQPGLALLRLAQRRGDDAVSAIRRGLQATGDRLQRARLLPAYVEILLAAGEIEEARRGSEELAQVAAAFDTEVLSAMAAHARGAVALADGKPEEALEPLRRAFRVWHAVGAPYIAARLRLLLARACQALGDRDGARLELELARELFQRLGAAPDLAALDAVGGRKQSATRDGLSPRELEVLRLVATGKSNRAIAKQLFLSEKTIDRHVSNIFAKVNVASRAAATAYAYQHGLI